MKNVYVSCSWNNPKELDKTKSTLETKGFSVTSNGKIEKYDSTKIKKADFVVFVLSGFQWGCPLEKLSGGILKELVWCLNNRKPIFIMYKTCSGELHPYAVEITEGLVIQGLAGTSPNMEVLSTIDPLMCLVVPDNSYDFEPPFQSSEN